jgi:hypothetical protein
MPDDTDPACPACGHTRHPTVCTVVLPWWRRWFSGLTVCSCTYWDARWESDG